MSKINKGRIEPETGNVVFLPSDEIIPLIPKTVQSETDKSTSVEVYNNSRVFGRNIGTDFEIFDKTVNDSAGNTILEFNTLKAGAGIELTEQSGSILITSTNNSTFVPVATKTSTGIVSVGTDLLINNSGLLSFDRSILNNYQLKGKDYSGYVVFPDIKNKVGEGYRSKLLHFVIDSEMVSGIVVGNADSSISLSEEISFTGTVYFDSGRTICKGYLHCFSMVNSQVKFLYDFIPVANKQASIIDVVSNDPVKVGLVKIPMVGEDGEYFSDQDENDQAKIIVTYEPNMNSYNLTGAGASIVTMKSATGDLQMSQMAVGLSVGNGRKLRYKIKNYEFSADDMATIYIGSRTVHGASIRSLVYDFEQVMNSSKQIEVEVWDDMETQEFSTLKTNTLGLMLTDMTSTYPEYQSYKLYTGGEFLKVQKTINGPLLSGTSTQKNSLKNESIANGIPRGIEITHLVANASMTMLMVVLAVDVYVPEGELPAKCKVFLNDIEIATDITLSSNMLPVYNDYIVGEISPTSQSILDAIENETVTIRLELVG